MVNLKHLAIQIRVLWIRINQLSEHECHILLTRILVHIECLYVFKRDFARLMIFNKLIIHAQWCAAGWQAQHEISNCERSMKPDCVCEEKNNHL